MAFYYPYASTSDLAGPALYDPDSNEIYTPDTTNIDYEVGPFFNDEMYPSPVTHDYNFIEPLVESPASGTGTDGTDELGSQPYSGYNSLQQFGFPHLHPPSSQSPSASSTTYPTPSDYNLVVAQLEECTSTQVANNKKRSQRLQAKSPPLSDDPTAEQSGGRRPKSHQKGTSEAASKRNTGAQKILIREMKLRESAHDLTREYACEFCQGRFEREHDLLRHIRDHTEDPTYFCFNPSCGALPFRPRIFRADARRRHWNNFPECERYFFRQPSGKEWYRKFKSRMKNVPLGLFEDEHGQPISSELAMQYKLVSSTSDGTPPPTTRIMTRRRAANSEPASSSNANNAFFTPTTPSMEIDTMLSGEQQYWN